MNRSFSIHGLVALAALVAWVTAIVTLIVNRDNNWAFYPVLLCSIATIVGTLLLCRFLIKRKRVPSYGTLFGVPLTCACLLWIGPYFLEACLHNAWYLFTPDFWRHGRGGFADLYYPIGIIWATCILPAAAIVVYCQGRCKTDASGVA